MRQLMAEHSQRRGQTGPPRDGERRADRQTVRKVMDAVSNGDHIGKQTLLWGTREDNDDIHSSFSGLMGRDGALWGRAQGHLGPMRGEEKLFRATPATNVWLTVKMKKDAFISASSVV